MRPPEPIWGVKRSFPSCHEKLRCPVDFHGNQRASEFVLVGFAGEPFPHKSSKKKTLGNWVNKGHPFWLSSFLLLFCFRGEATPKGNRRSEVSSQLLFVQRPKGSAEFREATQGYPRGKHSMSFTQLSCLYPHGRLPSDMFKLVSLEDLRGPPPGPISGISGSGILRFPSRVPTVPGILQVLLSHGKGSSPVHTPLSNEALLGIVE